MVGPRWNPPLPGGREERTQPWQTDIRQALAGDRRREHSSHLISSHLISSQLSSAQLSSAQLSSSQLISSHRRSGPPWDAAATRKSFVLSGSCTTQPTEAERPRRDCRQHAKGLRGTVCPTWALPFCRHARMCTYWLQSSVLWHSEKRLRWTDTIVEHVMLCLVWFTSVFRPVFVVEQLENFVALRFIMHRIFFQTRVVTLGNFLARDLHNTLDVFFVTLLAAAALAFAHFVSYFPHFFLCFSMSRFLLRGIASRFTSTQGPFQKPSCWSVDHHTCHAWCFWKVDESSLELLLLLLLQL